MQASSINFSEVDFFNYHAIALLDSLGKIDPSQLEIDLVEDSLKQIFSNPQTIPLQ